MEKDYVYAGLIAAELNDSATIVNCSASGSIKISTKTDKGINMYVGGIVGQIYNGGTVEKCYNSASVHSEGGEAFTGGIVGGIKNSGAIIKYCYNSGDISGVANASFLLPGRYAACGGILGGGNNDASVEIQHCANSGKIHAEKGLWMDAGGLMGCTNGGIISVSMSNSGYIAGKLYEGGSRQNNKAIDGNEVGSQTNINPYTSVTTMLENTGNEDYANYGKLVD